MIKKYVYNEKEYSNSWAVRQAIDKAENTAFGPEPTGEYEEKKAFWEQFGVTYTEEPDPEPTEEELLEQAKRERAKQVAAIKVEVDGMTFDGDETSQGRMSRTISAAIAAGLDLNTTKRVWVLADNTIAEPTIAQLGKALHLAGDEQTRLWTVPYEEQEITQELGLLKVGI